MKSWRFCTIEGCDRKHVAKGLCQKHYDAGRDRRRPPKEPDGRLSTAEVCEQAGVTWRQLTFWVETGRVRPAELGVGSGSRSRWDPWQVDAIRRVAERLEWGMTLEAAFRLVDPPVPEPAIGLVW